MGFAGDIPIAFGELNAGALEKVKEGFVEGRWILGF